MLNFSYSAVDNKGKNKKGLIQAEDIKHAFAQLKEQGVTIVNIKQAASFNQNLNIALFNKKPKPRELAVFCRQFVSIQTAGVPVISALEMLAQQTENNLLKGAIEQCRVDIGSGMSLSQAMNEHESVFPKLLVTMVAAGEASGSLDISFTRMAIQFEKDAKLQALIKRTSAYPTVVFFVAIVIVIMLLTFVVPSFEEILLDLNVDMPAFSSAVIGAGKFMQKNWLFVTAAIIAIIIGIYRFSITNYGKNVISELQLKIPLVNKLTVKTASARMCRTLATLMSAGVPLIQAIDISANVMTNVKFKQCLLNAKEQVAIGRPLSEPLFDTHLFPNMVCQMMKIGEQAGDVEGMLTKLADYYDEEVQDTTATVLAALEPLIIVFLAAIIITIVLAVMLPMTSIYEGLDNL